MAEVRVTCPTCKAELAIDEEHLGKEVECGSCLGAFVAEDPKTKKKPYKMRRNEREDDDDDEEEDRPKKKKRRRRDDEDDYDYSPPGSDGGGNGLGMTSLILGLVSIVPTIICCCAPISTMIAAVMQVAGVSCGALGLRSPNGRGLSICGVAINVIGLILNALFFAGMFAPMAQRMNFK